MAGVRLEFAQFGHFDYFNIYRNSASTSEENLGQPIGASSTMYYEDLTVEPNRDYYYRVGVIRDLAEKFSEEFHVKTLVEFNPPYDLMIEFKNDETNRLELNWKTDGFVDEQRYYCSEMPIDPENLPSPKAVLAGDVRTYVDTAIEAGKTYYVRIGSVKNGVEKISGENYVTAVIDPNWSNVVSYLRFNNNFNDEKGRIWTAAGGATITSDAKYGGGALDLTTLGSYLSTQSHADFYLDGDFTIEFFSDVKILTGFTEAIWLGSNTQSWQNNVAYFGFSPSRIYVGDFFSGINAYFSPLSGYKHYCLARKDGVVSIYREGKLLISEAFTRPLNFAHNGTLIGNIGWNLSSGTSKFKGVIDEFRVTKGVCRYTSEFTPPSSQFPNS